VAPDQLAEAWENRPLPIGEGQTISQPLVVARMCALLELRPGVRVLDVGTGSGYHAALLAHLVAPGGRVISVERHGSLARAAAARLASLGVDGVEVRLGDGALGAPDEAPFDAVNVAAAGREVPGELVAQLAPGGRLVAPVGEGEDQRLVLVRRSADGRHVERRALEPVRFVPLV
ncbi:MAG TPA: protein-L-isoaspartate(D-aspartate) O-methyltransferase, partial [Solirubrobacteraceae bacterium]